MIRCRNRHLIFILSLLIVAVISAVSFVVSYAYWSDIEGSTTTVKTDGTLGQYYVDYDKPFVEPKTTTETKEAPLKDNINDSEKDSLILQFKKSATDSTIITVKFVFNVVGSPSLVSRDDLFFHIWIKNDDFTTWQSTYLDDSKSTKKKAVIRNLTKAHTYSEFTGFIIASASGWQSDDVGVKGVVTDIADNYVYTMDISDSGLSLAKSEPFTIETTVTENVVKHGSAVTTVRSVNTNGNATYKNYVCVRRENQYESDGTLAPADPSHAYVEFSVSGEDLGAVVTEFTVRRAKTSADGTVLGGSSNVNVCGSPVGKPLSYINGNTYIVLDFGADADKFYALDVTVTTDSAVTYHFSADATYKDTHTFKMANSYYLGIDDFSMRESVYVGAVGSDPTKIDASIITTLVEGKSFKLFASSDGTGGDIVIEKYFGIASASGSSYSANITYSPASIAANFTPPTSNGGNDANITVKTSGKYMLHWYGAVSQVYGVDYTVGGLEITLIEAIENNDDLDNETTEAGYYVIGAFTQNKTYEGLKLTPSDEVVGVYEKTTKSLVAGNPYTIVYRATDGGSTVNCMSGTVTANDVGSLGATVAYDAFTGHGPSDSLQHRFVVDFGGLDISQATELSLNYRASITGVSDKATLFKGVGAEVKDLYYADVNDNAISSITVKATSNTVRHNSFDINAITAGRKCDFTFKSYGIKATEFIGEGNKANWTGIVQSYEKGEYGVEIPFGLNLSAIAQGNVVVYNKSSMSGYTYGNVFLPMDASADAEWDREIVLDTRYGKAHDALIGTEFLIYYNGNAMSAELDDRLIRVTHEQGSHSYRIINNDKAQGKFTVKTRKSFYDAGSGAYTDNLNITFVSGAAIDETPITECTPQNEGYYVMGQFSGWDLYPSHKLRETNIKGAYHVTIDEVITTSDSDVSGMYKIVYVPSATPASGNKFTYYGISGGKLSINNSGDNIPITSQDFYFDTYAAARGNQATAEEAFPTLDKLRSVYRVVYQNNSGIDGANSGVRIHFWDSSKTGDPANWSAQGNLSDGNFAAYDDRPYMLRGGSTIWYYDVIADAKYNGEYMSLQGVLVSATGNTYKSPDMHPQFTTTDGEGYRSYMIRFDGTNWSGSKLEGTWDSNVGGVDELEDLKTEISGTGDSFELYNLGAEDNWALRYDITSTGVDPAVHRGWILGAYVGGSRQLVSLELINNELEGGWDDSINLYGHVFSTDDDDHYGLGKVSEMEGDEKAAALSKIAAIRAKELVTFASSSEKSELLNSASEETPVTVTFVRQGMFVSVYASDGGRTLHIGTVSLERFKDISGVYSEDEPGSSKDYTYDNSFGVGFRTTSFADGNVVSFAKPVISNIRYSIGADKISEAIDDTLGAFKVILSQTRCTSERDNYYIGDHIKLIADAPEVGTQFDHFEVDGKAIDGDTFVATAILHRVRAVYTSVNYLKIEEHGDTITSADGNYVLPKAQVIAADGSDITNSHPVTVTATDPTGKSYTVTDGVANVPTRGARRLTVTYSVPDLGLGPVTRYITVQRSGSEVYVYYPELLSIGLLHGGAAGDGVEFDARVKRGDDAGSIKFTPNSDEASFELGVFDFNNYNVIEFYVYAENAKSGMFAGICWAGDTYLKAGEWVKITVDKSALESYQTFALNETVNGDDDHGKLSIRVRNGSGTPVWVSSVTVR